VCGAPFDLPLGGVRECTAHYLTTAADVAAGHIVNAVTATGTPPSGPPASDSASDETPLEELPGISITKHASVSSFGTPGQPVSYTFLVTSKGNVALHHVTMHDNRLGDVCSGPFDLPFNGVRKCTVHYVTTAADVAAGHIANTVTVTAVSAAGVAVRATASDDIPLRERPAISIKKSADVSSFTAAGRVITYAYIASNNGDVRMQHVTVTDNKAGRARCPATTLAPGASIACTARYTTTTDDVTKGEVVNIATAAGYTPRHSRVTAKTSLTIALQFVPVTG
jgi:hypothetical protein